MVYCIEISHTTIGIVLSILAFVMGIWFGKFIYSPPDPNAPRYNCMGVRMPEKSNNPMPPLEKPKNPKR